ncbi:MAG: DUF4412 domain-containing protein [bacterium]
MKALGMSMMAITMVISWAQAGWAEEMPQPKVEYSADKSTEMMMDGEFTSIEGKVFHSQGKEREEMIMQGSRQIRITRRDIGVMWMLMPDEGMYMEHSMQSGQGKSADISSFDIQGEVVGEEEINGIKTTKSKMVMTGPDGTKYGGFYWTTKDGIMIKMRSMAKIEGMKMPMNIELTNLKIGKQDPSLFEIPPGYRKMGFGGMMGGGMGMPDMEGEGEDGSGSMEDIRDQMKDMLGN